MSAIALRMGPYHYEKPGDRVSLVFTERHHSRKFTMILSTAYNAGGMIGPEMNGIVILDDNRKQVLADKLFLDPNGGYFGASPMQRTKFEEIKHYAYPQFMEMVNTSKRNRYDLLPMGTVPKKAAAIPWRTELSYCDPEIKSGWHERVMQAMHNLAKALGYKKGNYDVRSNKAGIAVSGEVTLHTDDIYVQVGQPSFGSWDRAILVRTCKGRKDYTGGPNNFFAVEMLGKSSEFAAHIERIKRSRAA